MLRSWGFVGNDELGIEDFEDVVGIGVGSEPNSLT